jgi:hypothetical protein
MKNTVKTFKSFLLEKKAAKPPSVYFDEDETIAFPPDTVSAMERQINKLAKDFETQYSSAIELVDACFEFLQVPKPTANLNNRWKQYTSLIAHAVKELYDARGETTLKAN